MKKNLIILFSSAYLLAGKFVLAACTPGNPKDPSCNYGLEDTVAGGAAGVKGAETDIPKLAGQLIGQALAFVGVIFFGLIVYGGFKWMTAQGDAKQANDAKDIIIRATIGLVVIFSAYALTAFIGDIAQNPTSL